MPNPFNPLDWLQSTQDWFSRTEKSSGFRPYLIFFLLCSALGIALLSFFHTVPSVQFFSLCLIGVPAFFFIVLFAWKSERDPNFCRSESHVQKIRKYELEMMGNETKQIEGEVLQATAQLPDSEKPSLLSESINGGGIK